MLSSFKKLQDVEVFQATKKKWSKKVDGLEAPVVLNEVIFST